MKRNPILWILGALVAATGCTAPVEGGGASAALIGEDGACTSHQTTLYAGRHIDAGSVEVSSDDTFLTVDITAAGGFEIAAYHIYAGFGPPPTNRAGAPRPGHFPYHGSFPTPTEATSLSIPLSELGAACGETLTVAVHTELLGSDPGVQEETGWADGPNTFRRGWGTYFDFQICCDDGSCVYPKWIWRDHADWWSLSSLEMGGRTHDETEMMDLLWTPAWGDASIEVAHQYIGAALNAADGAGIAEDEYADLVAAHAWLAANVDADGDLGYGIYSIHPAYAEGHALAERLRDYNEGRGSEPLCSWQ